MGISYSIIEKVRGAENVRLSALSDRSDLNNVIGRRVTRAIIKHFQTYSASHPNKLGGKRTNYVAKMGDATSYTYDADGTKISIAHEGARLRIEGGTVKPVKGKYLTIPAVTEAYGKRASEFPNLNLLFRREDGKVRAWALAIAPNTPVGKGGPKRKGATKALNKNTGRVLFFLVRSANIPANRDLLLSDDEIMKAALDATRAYLSVKGGRGASDS